MRRVHLVALAALLVFPAIAEAKGTWVKQSDLTTAHVEWQSDDGQAYTAVRITFTQPVSVASTNFGVPCQKQNDPAQVICQATGNQQQAAASGALDASFTTAVGCADQFKLEAFSRSINGAPVYTAQEPITSANTCETTPPPPATNPAPPPPPAQDDEKPAGAPVAPVTHLPIVVGAGPGGGPLVKVLGTPKLDTLSSFFAFDPAFDPGVAVAIGDVNGDGKPDVIAGAGPGGGPHVKVFDGATGGLLRSFFAFDPAFKGGVNVAAGDVNGDGRADVIVAAGPGGGPQVKVFDGATGAQTRSFLAFEPAFGGGVRVAAGDWDGDGRADLVAGAGPGGGPRVAIFGGSTGALLKAFNAFDAGFTGGVFVGAGDWNGDGRANVVVGAGGSGAPQVRVFGDGSVFPVATFTPFGTGFGGGVRVAVGDVDGDGRGDVLAAAGPGGGPQLTVIGAKSGTPIASAFVFDPAFKGGVNVGATMLPGPLVPSTGILIGLSRWRLPVTVPKSAVGTFRGTVSILLPAVQRPGARAAAVRYVKVATGTFRAKAGARVRAKLRVSRRGRKVVGKRKRATALVSVTGTDGAGNTSTRSRKVKVRFK